MFLFKIKKMFTVNFMCNIYYFKKFLTLLRNFWLLLYKIFQTMVILLKAPSKMGICLFDPIINTERHVGSIDAKICHVWLVSLHFSFGSKVPGGVSDDIRNSYKLRVIKRRTLNYESTAQFLTTTRKKYILKFLIHRKQP